MGNTLSDVRTRMATVGVALLVMMSFAGVGVATVAASNSGAQDGEAQVRVAHMSPDAPAVDVLVDGEPVVEGVEFGAVSDYLALSEGHHDITVQTSEDETVVIEENVTVEADTAYTAAAVGEVSEETLELAVFEDDFETPSDENTSVRLVHVSPDAPAVDVTVAGTDTVLFDNVSFGNATDYVEIPADDYELEIRGATEDNDGEVVTTVNVSAEGGTVYSAFAAGYLSPDEAPADTPFEVIFATDAGGEMTEMMDSENETTAEA
ncbi:DUF4397 domain-containing protein [Halorussus pelagicus]|uniref:DUF4397 domain-containing protein n=1 Tax=Halorussus pelagicus TaxID=2505977 RepID=UPI000FFB8BBD|nr:DUF4397 domain-containing protein [Halorussus pelagicus]